jgi:hypothetical protein
MDKMAGWSRRPFCECLQGYTRVQWRFANIQSGQSHFTAIAHTLSLPQTVLYCLVPDTQLNGLLKMKWKLRISSHEYRLLQVEFLLETYVF